MFVLLCVSYTGKSIELVSKITSGNCIQGERIPALPAPNIVQDNCCYLMLFVHLSTDVKDSLLNLDVFRFYQCGL